MDKAEAISQIREERKKDAESRFKDRVAELLYMIEKHSNALREAKLELKNLEYVEPALPDVEL